MSGQRQSLGSVLLNPVTQRWRWQAIFSLGPPLCGRVRRQWDYLHGDRASLHQDKSETWWVFGTFWICICPKPGTLAPNHGPQSLNPNSIKLGLGFPIP